MLTIRAAPFVLIALVLTVSCRNSSPQVNKAVALTPLYKTDSSKARSPQKATPTPRTEWQFNVPPKALPEKFPTTYGWEAGPGISELRIDQGKLVGQTTQELPVLHFERTSGLQNEDPLHSIEVRLRVSKGSNLRVDFASGEEFNAEQVIDNMRDFPTTVNSTPVIAGEQFHSYILRPKFTPPSRRIRHIVLVPSDAIGAKFEIESMRLIFRKEYLAGIQSGVSWESLGGVYQQAIVSRSPEKIILNVRMPHEPWLDLNIGTVEDGKITFQVTAQESNGSDSKKTSFQRTLTRSHHWEPIRLELPQFSGRPVQFSLSLTSDQDGMIGFWGSPVVRSHRAEKLKNVQRVILIMADTLRRDHLNVYGYKRTTTPNLARMASRGVLFQNCISQATWTKVAGPTLVTSLYPITHGVLNFSDRLPSSAKTLAEIFEEAGFATLGFSSNLFTATFSNFHQGFQQLHEDASLANPDSSKTTREYMDRLLPWLSNHQDVPFFVFLHAYDPHDPYEPYPPYNSVWADPNKKEEHQRHLKDVRKVIAEPLMRAFGMPNRQEMLKAGFNPEAYVSYDKDLYDGSILAMDAEFGRLLEHLNSLGLDQKTLIVFVGDHGEEFLEHGRTFHGQTVYGELTNVPLIFWMPGRIDQNVLVKDNVEIIDVLPTILVLCGMKPPEGIQGHSFASLLTNGSEKSTAEAGEEWNRPAFSEKNITLERGAPPPQETESFSVVLDQWKLIHNTVREKGQSEFELYDVQKDPLDRVDLANQNPQIVERLQKELAAWRKKTAASHLKPDQDAAKGMSQEELERLRSLGYIQ